MTLRKRIPHLSQSSDGFLRDAEGNPHWGPYSVTFPDICCDLRFKSKWFPRDWEFCADLAEFPEVLVTLPAPRGKCAHLWWLFSLLSSVGDAHRLCSWCYWHAQCCRSQYHWVHRWLLCLCQALLCPTTSYPCNQQVCPKKICSSNLVVETESFGWQQPNYNWLFIFGQVTALNALAVSSMAQSSILHSLFPVSPTCVEVGASLLSVKQWNSITCFHSSLLGFVMYCLVFSRTPSPKNLFLSWRKVLSLSFSPDCHSQTGGTAFFLHQIVTAVGLSVGLCQLPFEIICSQPWITEPDKNSSGETKTKIQNFKWVSPMSCGVAPL